MNETDSAVENSDVAALPVDIGTVEHPQVPAPGVDLGEHVEDMSSRLLGAEITDVPADALRPIIQSVRNHHPEYKDADLGILRRAFDRAVWQHRNQRRRSGEPYIIHPIAVAQIIADLGMTPPVVAAGLLHDTVEDTDYTLDDCRREFGDTVAGLVDGVTKISKIEYGDSAQAETIRKLVVAMSRDVRVLVVKLADRVHNARTWRYVKPESAAKKARETLDIYAPLANRLGMNAIKTELEELSFKQIAPKIYNEIVLMTARKAGQRDVQLRNILAQIRASLKDQNIDAVVTGRPKDYFSIYQKMVVRGHDFEDIYDLMGVRIIVDTIRDCYAALGTVHAKWTPVPGRFKDYIAMPKLNMYRSLHTTVIGPGGKPVEIQIRTWDMHRQAEYGIAAHWKYKENGQAGRELSTPDASDRERDHGTAAQAGHSDSHIEKDNLEWIQQLADWSSETPDSNEFLGSLRQDLGASQVYVFTPKGKVITLPQNSTPVDFAYAVHTEVGHRAMGSRVNGRLVPLDTPLKNGDTVEIITSNSPTAGPSHDWLSFVRSPRARGKIRQWFSKERRSETIEEGKDELTRALRRRNLPVAHFMNDARMTSVAGKLGYSTTDALYSALGEGQISAVNVITRLAEDQEPGDVGNRVDSDELSMADLPTQSRPRQNKPGAPAVSVEGLDGIWVKLAKCCNPVPGDPIVGFITKAQGVSVHRADCVNLLSLRQSQPERIVEVHWTGTEGTYLIKIQVEALDRGHLLSDLAQVLADYGVNILSGSAQLNNGHVALIQFEFEMADPQHLGMLFSAIRKVDDVFDVYRLTGTTPSTQKQLRKAHERMARKAAGEQASGEK